jgi:hypothetical protein
VYYKARNLETLLKRFMYMFVLAGAALILCRDAANLAIDAGDPEAFPVHASQRLAGGR